MIAALVVALSVLTVLCVLQILVSSGLPFGRFVWGGQHRVLPRRLRVGSAAAVFIYLGVAAVLLRRTGVAFGGSDRATEVACWVLVGFFSLSVAANAISRSPAERWAMTPASALLAGATLAIALG